MINPALAPITKLRATEAAYTDRESRVQAETNSILSAPDKIGSLLQDRCLTPSLTSQLAALCRANIERQDNYRPTGNNDEQRKEPFDADVLFHEARLFKVLWELATQEADAAIPDVDAQAVEDAI